MKLKIQVFKHDDCFGTKTVWLGYTGIGHLIQWYGVEGHTLHRSNTKLNKRVNSDNELARQVKHKLHIGYDYRGPAILDTETGLISKEGEI